MNLTKRLKVEPGSQVKLASIDPSFHGEWKSRRGRQVRACSCNLARITELQRKLYADRRHILSVVLQGIDGAGKDGTCWHVISAMDPEGVNVHGFQAANGGRTRPRLSVARSPARAGARAGRDLQSLALRGRTSRARP